MTRFTRGRPLRAATLVVAWLATAAPVLAHQNEVIRFGSFLGGITHPVLGADHLLAMLSVGIVSTQIGGRAILTVPATFVIAMAFGGLLGLVTPILAEGTVEYGIGASVLLLGAAIARGRSLPLRLTMAFVAFFGMCHGYAHGVETPSIAEPALYVSGFLLGTALIHLTGVLVGEVARQYASGPPVLRTAGVAILVMGGLFLLGIV